MNQTNRIFGILHSTARRAGFAPAAAAAGLLLAACASTPPNRNPVGERFPSVEGTSLEGERYRVPEDFAGAPVLLIVAYAQKAQFDADRWAYGLLQAETPVRIVELPTIGSPIPRLIRSTIGEGMRRGIPSEGWGGVITIYQDGKTVERFTGRENPRNVRVALLDAEGRVAWFHDRGYSAATMKELDALCRSMTQK